MGGQHPNLKLKTEKELVKQSTYVLLVEMH